MKRFATITIAALCCLGATAQTYTLAPEPGAVDGIESGFTMQWSTTDVAIADSNGIKLLSGDTSYTLYTFMMPNSGRLLIAPIDSDGDVLPITEPGTYILDIEEGALTVAGKPNSLIEAVYTIAEPGSSDMGDWRQYFTLQPEPGAYNCLEAIVVTFPRAANYAISSQAPIVLEAPAGAPAYDTTADDSGIVIRFASPATADGTYTFTIPTGKFSIEGTPCPELSFSYIVDSTIAPQAVLSFSPEGGQVDELSEIVMSFNGEWAQGDRTLKFSFTCADPAVTVPALRSRSGADSYRFYFEDDAVITTPGTYTLTIPAGRFTINDKPNDLTSVVYVIADNSATKFPTYTADPAEGTYTNFAGVSIAFDAENLTCSGGITLSCNDVVIPSKWSIESAGTSSMLHVLPTDADGNAIEPLTAPGKYCIDIAAESLTANGISNPALHLEYSITSLWTGTCTASPASGSTLSAFSGVRLTFPVGTALSVNEYASPAEFPALWACDPATGQASEKITNLVCYAAGTNLELSIGSPVAATGRYAVIVPQGYLTVGGYEFEATLYYTVFDNSASTVIFEEDFDSDYTQSFPYMLDKDALQPNSAIASYFYSNAAGQTMPWWVVKDTDTTNDRFMASHSYYTEPGQSNDWLISRPIEIPTTGFVLSIDVQSLPWRDTARLSDLTIFITESLIDLAALPSEPTAIWREIPAGSDRWNCENDWFTYLLPLDAWAGRTIYINLVNQNYDNDILCIDHVCVSRNNPAEIIVESYTDMTEESEIAVRASLQCTGAQSLGRWSVALRSGDATISEWSGDALTPDSPQTLEATVPLTLGEVTPFVFELTADGSAGYTAEGQATRLAFIPFHTLLMEESTSVHCGNCPMAAFTMESLLENPEIGPHIAPVSIHISSMGYDPMVCEAYDNAFGQASAPLVYTERSPQYDGFVPMYDYNCDPENPLSFAYRTVQRINHIPTVGIDVEADWQISAASPADTTAISCVVTVRPAINFRDADLRLACILTENNVGLDNNQYWVQTNYLSGEDELSTWGGWTELPKYVTNLRYHDVARAITDYDGLPGSLPATLKAGEEYTWQCTLDIPDTEKVHDGILLMQPAIQRQFCQLTAIVIDASTGLVLNAARIPMSDVANDRYSTQDAVDASVGEVISDPTDGPAVMYDLTGRPAPEHPTPGIYIRRTSSSSTKVLIR